MERVYVANLPPDIRIKDIDDFFRPFGKLVYIDVNHRANPVFAYVQFDSPRNAFNAVKSRHGYDYEGYTLQLRLVENEVRKRRDATPPPPPPSMFNSYERQNNAGFNNSLNNNRMGGNFTNSSLQLNSNSQWSNNNRSGIQQQQQNMSQYSVSNRLNMNQQNMMDYSTNNRSGIQQQSVMPYSSSGRSNTQQYSNTNLSNMQQQQYSGSNMLQQQYSGSNINQQQYSGSNINQQQYSNRSNIQHQNNYSNRSDMNYSNTNRSNMQQQNMNMMNYSNNSSWNSVNNSMDWNTGNYNNDGNNYTNFGSNEIYNSNNDPYARRGFEDNYTRGLSRSDRRLFNRYIRKGFSPKVARTKVLEGGRYGTNLPEGPTDNSNPNDPTNAALETIGNTILSFLSTNPVDNYNNGPSSSNAGSNVVSQIPRNAVSKKQYLKSLSILKTLRGKRVQTAKDRLSKKYHTQIVKDYEQYEKSLAKTGGNLTTRNNFEVTSTLSEAALSLKLRKKKRQLMTEAQRTNDIKKDRSLGGAFRKRKRTLMDAGFSELEAKVLGLHPLEKLRSLIALKKDYDMATKKTDFIPSNKKVDKQIPKTVVYRNDINYLKMYEQQKFSSLSTRIKIALRACLTRIHDYEKHRELPLTTTKFTHLLSNKSGQKTTTTQKKQDVNQKGSTAKKTVVENKTKTSTTNTDKKKEKIKEVENTKPVNKELQEKENDENAENQNNEDIAEEQHEEGNEEEIEDTENPGNDDDRDDQNEDVEEQNEK